MGDMLIRDIPEPLKREIEQAARKGGQSLSGKAIDLLRKGMVAEKAAEARAGSFSMGRDSARHYVAENAIGDEFAKIMDEIEADRKRDFGRPVEDFE